MSEPEPLPEQPEDVRARPVVMSVVATVLGIVASGVLVWFLLGLHAEGGGRSDEARPALIPPATPFDGSTPLEARRHQQQMSIETWSWADREHHRVRMPVTAAIDAYLGGRP
jgi:hypothetical protein